jgi:hypothetical protein
MGRHVNQHGLETDSPLPLSRKRPGLKPGQKHSGQFQKGNDPRRHMNGPYKSTAARDFKDQVAVHAEDALQVLAGVMMDAGAPVKERTGCAELILAHAHGRPVDRVAHAMISDGNGNQEAMGLDALAGLAQRRLDNNNSLILETDYTEIDDDTSE